MTKSTEHGNYGYGYDDVYRLVSADNPETQDDEAYTGACPELVEGTASATGKPLQG